MSEAVRRVSKSCGKKGDLKHSCLTKFLKTKKEGGKIISCIFFQFNLLTTSDYCQEIVILFSGNLAECDSNIGLPHGALETLLPDTGDREQADQLSCSESLTFKFSKTIF